MGKKNFDNRLDIRIAKFIEKHLVRYRESAFENFLRKENIIWERLFEDKKVIPFQLDDSIMLNLYKDSSLSKVIYRGFEDDELIFLKKILRKGDLFFDIGANIGLYSLTASRIIGDEGHIYAFEPTPQTYGRLLENIDANAFTNILPIQAGLSDSNDTLTFYVSNEGNDAWNSFAKQHFLKDSSAIQVKTITLDDYIGENNIDTSRIRLMKIDVEGWELNVLKGAIKLLSSKNAPVLLMEFTESNLITTGHSSSELFDYVTQFGYCWYQYNSKKNKLVKEKKKPQYEFSNLIAIKDMGNIIL